MKKMTQKQFIIKWFKCVCRYSRHSLLLTAFQIILFPLSFARGPGFDGGGGGLVLSTDGQLRFANSALQENVSLKPWSREDLEKAYQFQTNTSQKLNLVAHEVSPEQFFSCSDRIAKNSSNPLVRPLQSSIFHDLTVLKTKMPIPTLTQKRLSLYYIDRYGSPRRTISPSSEDFSSSLLTQSIPSQSSAYYHPVAAFLTTDSFVSVSREETNPEHDRSKRIGVLVYNETLYEQLSESDRCQLQLHELLRHANSFEYFEELRFFTRQLLQLEIELLSREIFMGSPIGPEKLPTSLAFQILQNYPQFQIKDPTSSELQSLVRSLRSDLARSRMIRTEDTRHLERLFHHLLIYDSYRYSLDFQGEIKKSGLLRWLNSNPGRQPEDLFRRRHLRSFSLADLIFEMASK